MTGGVQLFQSDAPNSGENWQEYVRELMEEDSSRAAHGLLCLTLMARGDVCYGETTGVKSLIHALSVV